MEVSAITVIATLAGAHRQLPQKAPRRSAMSADGALGGSPSGSADGDPRGLRFYVPRRLRRWCSPKRAGAPLLVGPGSFGCSPRAGESRRTRATRPVVSGRPKPPWATLPLANSRATAAAVKPSPSQTRRRSALAELPAGTASHLVFAPEQGSRSRETMFVQRSPRVTASTPPKVFS
jgi:hypothetical protein